MPFFKTHRGLDWFYEVSGSGETIVMIHGLGGTGRFWKAQEEFLHTDFQVVTLDLPGHGRTAWMPLSLTEMTLDIRQILISIGITQFSMLASSMGGLVALELYRMVPKIKTLSQQFDGDYAAILDIFFRSLFTIKERKSERFNWVKQLRQAELLPQREALKHFLVILEKTDLRDRIASMICPLQFITGSEDYICPREIMVWVALHTHNARFDFIDGCGHLPFLVEAKEYNRLLEDFLLN